jgi:predicted membrane protein (TIGR00267 family)
VHAARPAEAHRIITEAMPPVLASLLARGDLEKLRRGLLDMRDLPAKASLTREDWLGAFAVFLLVLLSTFPIVVPFLLFDQAYLALRVSNAIAIVMLFVLGYQLGQHSGHHPLRTGFGMVTIGLVLVGLAVALGG